MRELNIVKGYNVALLEQAVGSDSTVLFAEQQEKKMIATISKKNITNGSRNNCKQKDFQKVDAMKPNPQITRQRHCAWPVKNLTKTSSV